ncbi:related to putative copper-activated transcription factor [Rhynchosporium secalis]|uniref:Related to putative copper-activated transcription factor n=1 Tax=Rhynchosporium secalis TaxID=38038 RepID=A0A1E1MGD5_RHYSE|nr:related to putative copper-activated transcription factor [Rhynchosporium secalis]
MPLINGMKMACEPCIRGHRSTKCTHANERLMVPVRKPGRPLSACPHPQDQPCGCSSVTAAIPRKQACHCSTGTITPGSDIPSPTKVTFKVDKRAGRPLSSRKQPYDPMALERMDASQLNIHGTQHGPVPYTNGYAVTAAGPQMIGFAPPFSHHHYGIPFQPSGQAIYTGPNGYMNGVIHSGLEHVVESPLATPIPFGSGDSGKFTNGSSYMEARILDTAGEIRRPTGGSCCAPKQNGATKQNGHSHTSSSSSISEPREPAPVVSSCCSSKATRQIPKLEPVSTQSTPHLSHQILPQNGVHFPQPTVFTYPATYGSFQNPLHPSAWRQSIQTNNYSQAPFAPGMLPFDAPLGPGMETVHTCGCGAGCQCVGCAAHPYNAATKKYVWSAYEYSEAPLNNEPHAEGHNTINGNGSVNGNGIATTQTSAADQASSPTAHTPSSTTSGAGEEQNYSAADFFFVNYPFSDSHLNLAWATNQAVLAATIASA